MNAGLAPVILCRASGDDRKEVNFLMENAKEVSKRNETHVQRATSHRGLTKGDEISFFIDVKQCSYFDPM